MLPQKGCILMYPLDNGKSGYTWKEEWNIPYESLWGRIEKFRSVNVLDSKHLDKIIKIGADSLYTIFSTQFLVYRKQSYSISQMCSILKIDTDILKNFTHTNGIFDNQLRYCPICMKEGYHSFLHQLIFFDKCFLHQETHLEHRCKCTDTYVLKRKLISKQSAFQCEFCGEKILTVPSSAEGIFKSWGSSNVININKCLQRTNTYQRIHILDILLFYQIQDKSFRKYTNFNSIQKQVLQDIMFIGKTNCEPRFIIKRSNTNKNNEKIVMSELLNHYILNKYNHRTILEHFWHISNRYYRYEIENYDIELLTIFYLIRDLQCKRNVDQLPYGGLYENTAEKIQKVFSEDHIDSNAINLIRDVFIRMELPFDGYPELYNIVLKEFTMARFKHIYNCFINNYPEEYPCTSSASISYNNWDYPVYIFIKNKDDEILLY